MDHRTIHIFFALLQSALNGNKLSDADRKNYSCEMFQDLIQMASKHDVLHLIALGLKHNDLIPEQDKGIEKSVFKAAYRCESLDYELDTLCNILEKAKIPHLPLKGSVVRRYYPEGWMRTSGDIDILIHEEDIEAVMKLLVDDRKYEYITKDSHVVMLRSPNRVYIEFHYQLIENDIARESWAVLDNVWNTSNICDGKEYLYEMSDDMFYFYHIAHMAKHFECGGCGIRPFIDLWILDRRPADLEKRREMLCQGQLLTFAEAVRKLSRIWLENEEYEPVSQKMEAFILDGGVYGSNKNRITIQQQKKGGRLKYVLAKVFIPYDALKFHYPILQKNPWLTPFMEVRRWCKLVFCGHLRRTANELRYNSNITTTEAEHTKQFLDSIGL